MSRAETNFPSEDKTTIVCLHCGKSQDVGRKAMTITCKYCSKSLRLEDLRFKEYQARRVIETCGIITVEKKGQVVADRVHCGGLIVRGKAPRRHSQPRPRPRQPRGGNQGRRDGADTGRRSRARFSKETTRSGKTRMRGKGRATGA